MEHNLNLSALVLRKADYRDYDRMITLLSAERGKVEAVARGCRRPKSELLNAAEPFVCGQYQLYFAHERYTVTQCRVTDGFYPLRQDFDRLTMGARWLKLLEESSVEDEPAREMFDLALAALSYLSYSEIEPELLNAMFLMKLMRILGLSPAADRCAVCGKGENETQLFFDAQKGGCVCKGCSIRAVPISYGARRILLKAPRTPYKAVEKLVNHPDRQEAAAKMEEYVRVRFSGA